MSDEQRAAMRAAARRIDRVNEWLQLGGFVPAADFQRCLDAGISHVVDLREEHELNEENSPPSPDELEQMGVARRQVPVTNGSAPTRIQLEEVASWFASEEKTSAMYVHCGGGFGRAATMAIGLLIRDGSTYEAAIEEVRAVRPEIRLNDEQITWLRSLEPGSR